MSFWRRWLKQWGYVRIRDYGLIVTEAGQVIRISDGVVVNASAPAALPPAPIAAAYPVAPAAPAPTPPPPPPPAPAPAPALAPPPAKAASVEPAPAVVAPPKPRLQLPRASRQVAPPPSRPAPKLAPRKASGTAPPPLPRLRPSARPAGSSPDVTAVSERPVFEAPPVAKRPLPRLMGRPRIPPRPETENTTTITESDFDLPVGEPTLVDEPATSAARPEPAGNSVPLPRLSARLAARRKS